MAGVVAGLLWALLAGYAARLVPEEQKRRAIAIAMVGTPLALSLGVPAGTSLAQLVGWRLCFGMMSGANSCMTPLPTALDLCRAGSIEKAQCA